ncbi:hypothetical protein FISHEDRAFT_58454 [Fistulina hepatica ATCC 64428]|uniref:Uncharacterized protein n=1 Tax=Fistulina hepatica ATCC 64428 TaxID=1128425 RepID=A0A0D7AEM5_9AGAR|nr:hypothetical protein FISHEDRAFT_58454 [Fistulina hepatica ATCC 64428]
MPHLYPLLHVDLECIWGDDRGGRDNEEDNFIEYDDEDDGGALDEEAGERKRKECEQEWLKRKRRACVPSLTYTFDRAQETACIVICTYCWSDAPDYSNTARNLCVKAWSSKNLNGTTHKYVAYCNSIKDTPLGAEWKAAETAKKGAKTKAAAGGL